MKNSMQKIKEALEFHHKRCSEEGGMFIKDDCGEYIELDMGAEYGDSSAYENTVEALQIVDKLCDLQGNEGLVEKVALARAAIKTIEG